MNLIQTGPKSNRKRPGKSQAFSFEVVVFVGIEYEPKGRLVVSWKSSRSGEGWTVSTLLVLREQVRINACQKSDQNVDS